MNFIFILKNSNQLKQWTNSDAYLFIIGFDDVVTQHLTAEEGCCHLPKSPLMIRMGSIIF